MNRNTILFLLCSSTVSVIYATLITDMTNAFMPNTTTPTITFTVADYQGGSQVGHPYVFMAQAGTLTAANGGGEGVVVIRASVNEVPQTQKNDNNFKIFSLPTGSAKTLYLGYTQWNDPADQAHVGTTGGDNSATIFVGNQTGVYALYRIDTNELPRAGSNLGPKASPTYPGGGDQEIDAQTTSMIDLNAGFWRDSEFHQVFAQFIGGNVVAVKAHGQGLYYVLRETSLNQIVDNVYRLRLAQFENRITDVTPVKIITSGQKGAPSTITTLEIVPVNNDLSGYEELLIGSHSGAYLTQYYDADHTEGGMFAAHLDSTKTITYVTIPGTENKIIYDIYRAGNGDYNFVCHNSQEYVTVPKTISVTNGGNPANEQYTIAAGQTAAVTSKTPPAPQNIVYANIACIPTFN